MLLADAIIPSAVRRLIIGLLSFFVRDFQALDCQRQARIVLVRRYSGDHPHHYGSCVAVARRPRSSSYGRRLRRAIRRQRIPRIACAVGVSPVDSPMAARLYPDRRRARVIRAAFRSHRSATSPARPMQSLGLFFYSLLKSLKRFIVLLPDAAVRIAEDLRMRAGLSLSYDAASRREYWLPNDPHPYTWTRVPSPVVAAVRHG
jgi:hypothetical protein